MTSKLWAAKEAKDMTLKDKRRNMRVTQILESIADSPTTSIPQACCGELAKTKAAYRFIGTTAITEQNILHGHYAATIERIVNSKENILVISDGMDAAFTNLINTRGLGPTTSSATSLGIKLQNTFAIGSAGTCFGLIDQKYWARDKKTYGKSEFRSKKPTKEKESNHWLESLARVEESLPLDIAYTYLADGGADIYDFFAVKRRPNSALIIHQAQNRKTVDGKMFDILDQQDPIGYITQTLSRTPNNPERTVRLEVKIAAVEVKSPDKTKKINRSTTAMYTLIAKEVEADKPGSKCISWRLLTTIPLHSLDDAKKVLDLYTKRWIIERFHYVLKEGFHIEKLQLESFDNLKRAIALYSIVAWRVMYITYASRNTPDNSCTEILSTDEWKALWCYYHKKAQPPVAPPTIAIAVKMIAKIGGFLGRKGDGDPGAKVLWRGIMALEHITNTYLIFKGKDVGNV